MFNILPSSEAVRAGDLVFLGGIVGKDASGALVKPFDVAAQAEAMIARAAQLLRTEGLGLENLVFVTIYIPDLRYFNAMNEVYARLMPGPLPPRKLVVTPLVVEGALVEMTGIASTQPKRAISLPAAAAQPR
jgi:enamine deaminase RidA (YjgF/YER057c/UK114 family)